MSMCSMSQRFSVIQEGMYSASFSTGLLLGEQRHSESLFTSWGKIIEIVNSNMPVAELYITIIQSLSLQCFGV